LIRVEEIVMAKKRLKLVYVAGPFSAPTPWKVEVNVRAAEFLALELAKMGVVPVCPHTMYRHYEGELPYEAWMEITDVLLRTCDAVVALSTWEKSKGAVQEVRVAEEEMGIPVFFAGLGSSWRVQLAAFLEKPGDGDAR
jgi:hypothetical protein